MKKLYVTDLDGTLLDKNAKLSQVSEDILRPLIKNGLNFTVATARTPATAVDLLCPLNINLPIVAMSGAMIYDLNNKNTIQTNSLAQDDVEDICDMLDIVGQSALVYAVKDGKLMVYYKEFENDFEREFVKSRIGTPYKEFVKTDDYFTSLEDCEVVMFLFCMSDLRKIYTFYELLSANPNLLCYLYPHEYNSSGYILEVYTENCGKGKALQKLKEEYGFDKIIAFGDNFNDISMFKMAEESYAVANAIDDLKDIASGIIGSNNENSVAKFIQDDYNKPETI